MTQRLNPLCSLLQKQNNMMFYQMSFMVSTSAVLVQLSVLLKSFILRKLKEEASFLRSGVFLSIATHDMTFIRILSKTNTIHGV